MPRIRGPTSGRRRAASSELRLPAGPGVRIDFGYAEGDTVPPHYDSMIGKVIVTGASRREALARARRALAELAVAGVTTILPFHRAVLERQEFSTDEPASFTVYTSWIDAELSGIAEAARGYGTALAAARTPGEVGLPSESSAEDPDQTPTYRVGIKAPLAGIVQQLCVRQGDRVERGDVVAIMEAMKMEQPVHAEDAGIVACVNIGEGGFVDMDADIMGLD